MKKLICLILTLTLLLSLGVTAFADKGTETVSITYRGIKIVADGVTLDPRDANGNPTEPFILNGTTYLPVRAVASALGLNVAWDAATSTVTLTSGGEKTASAGAPAASKETRSADITYRDIKIVIDGKAITPTDANGNPVEPFIMDGTTYLPVRAVASALGLEVGWDAASSTVTLTASETSTVTITTLRSCDRAGETPISGTVRTETYRSGRIVSAETHSDSGELISTESYTYGGDGLLQFSIRDAVNDENDCYIKYIYRDGLLHSVKQYNGATRPKGHSIDTEYSYDECGNMVRRYEHLPMGSWEEYTAEYDDQGRIVSDSSEYYDIYANAFYRSSTEYFYDGALLVRSESVGLTTEYFYCSDGRLAKTVAENLDGTFTVVSYTYSD